MQIEIRRLIGPFWPIFRRLSATKVSLVVVLCWLVSIWSNNITRAQSPNVQSKSVTPQDQDLDDFLGPAQFSSIQLFKDQRFPNVITCQDGSILAIWGQSKLSARRSTDGGDSWSDPIAIGLGSMIHSGGAIVDEANHAVWVFAEAHHPPAERIAFCSRDHGLTWSSQSLSIQDDSQSHSPSLHMNEHGLTLLREDFAGRLIRPTRYYGPANEPVHWPTHYSNAIYSDDHGQTWNTTEPFPFPGTGEAAIVELRDGTLYYNSRRHWAMAGENPRRRWTAISRDGGLTWIEGAVCPALPDGPQDSDYGLMAGMIRLPIKGRDILIFSNVDSDAGRKQGTIWISLDGGQTWPHKKQLVPGPFAYSSLAVGRAGTAGSGWIYLFYEGNDRNLDQPVGGTIARFNLRWLVPDLIWDQIESDIDRQSQSPD